MRILSLGAGVQSTCLLLMSLRGERGLERVDLAVFADTGGEPEGVYRHLGKLREFAAAEGVEVRVVRKGGEGGEKLQDGLLRGDKYTGIPYFILGADGGAGIGRRQCTGVYKVDVVEREIRRELGGVVWTDEGGRERVGRVPAGAGVCEQWIGFSEDEIGRVGRGSGKKYVSYRYPLIELGMDREDCAEWLRGAGWEGVGKSACVFCPYRSDREWLELRERGGADWELALEVDRGVRGLPGKGEAFLHQSRVPLGEAHFVVGVEGDADGCSPYGCRSGEIAVSATGVRRGAGRGAGGGRPATARELVMEEGVRLYREGMSMEGVAAVLGVGKGRVWDALVRAGVERRKAGRPPKRGAR